MDSRSPLQRVNPMTQEQLALYLEWLWATGYQTLWWALPAPDSGPRVVRLVALSRN